jgi:predicted SAM-dependent methyltransferase
MMMLAKKLYCLARQFSFKAPRSSSPDGTLNLHLGCGRINAPGFINIDMAPMRHVHLVQDVSNLDRFRAESVDLIYASHVLEHFSHLRTLTILREWKRVLKPGGVLRLAVPNFDALVEIYRLNERRISSIQGMLYGGQDYPGNAHFAGFTYESLACILMEAGLCEVSTWGPFKGIEPYCLDHSGLEIDIGSLVIPVSLNVEAKNPN